MENSDVDPKSPDNASIDSMDLLSLTFRSLDPRNMSKQNNFLDPEDQTKVQRSDSSEETLRRPEDTKNSRKERTKNLKTIRLDEIAWHDTADSCWIAIYDFVYDCTDFLENHPGGADIILEYAGRDATLPFIGTGHSAAVRDILERYLIGELPPEERIFRVPNGVKVPEF